MLLLNIAIEENKDNSEYIELLNKITGYFKLSTPLDNGDNRNSVNHGYMHSRFWTQNSLIVVWTIS